MTTQTQPQRPSLSSTLKVQEFIPAPETRTLLVYSKTGAGKTYQLGRVASAVYEESGMITRWITAEPGGLTPVQKHIDKGIIDVVNLHGIVEYPKLDATKDPPIVLQPGCSPETLLQAVTRGGWTPIKIFRDEVKGTIVSRKLTKSNWSNVGLLVIESLSTIASLIKDYFLHSEIRLIDNVHGAYRLSSMDEERDLEYSIRAEQNHYQTVQDVMRSMIEGMTKLGVPLVAFGSHELAGGGKNGNIYGPEVIGSAMTEEVSRLVGTTVRLTAEITSPAGVVPETKEYRAYFQPHKVPTDKACQWPANPRIDPDSQEEFIAKHKHLGFDKGYFVCRPGKDEKSFGLDKFLLARDSKLIPERARPVPASQTSN